jgi:hypothetical protein
VPCIEWSSPTPSYYTYTMAWRPKVGPRDDDFLSTTTKRDRRRSANPFLGWWHPPHGRRHGGQPCKGERFTTPRRWVLGCLRSGWQWVKRLV